MLRTRKLLIAWLQAAAAALQFLTRLPVPYRFEYTAAVFRRSVVFYPVAGGLIGLLLSLLLYAAGLALPAGPAAALTLVLWVAVTGGLHLDGWMDSADGLLSHRPPERMLEIMKDSRVGAMGVMAAVLLLLVKYACLAALPGSAADGLLLLAVLPAWSRWWMTVGMAGWPYARKESGLGSLFRQVGWSEVSLAWAGAAAVTFAFTALGRMVGGDTGVFAGTGWVTVAGRFVLAATLLCGLFGGLAARTVSRKLGGLTGDLYGAMNEGLEALLLLVAVAACTALGYA
ncbi:adenosylcobinamide-GDP ribazoletransferase [Gorillibacterium sp. sgz500922]|uniref:adenosylcobinamide-GDP ribazoletransferase n=1 Tax=Gorillibacterium sp. sgz500922 TaxID=3446694 RepID=UPI003F6651F7